MSITHTVKFHDDPKTIESSYGISLQAIFEHPANAKLRATRQDSTFLQTGDVLNIPDGYRDVLPSVKVPSVADASNLMGDVYFEILDGAGYANGAIHQISAAEAFRKFDWIRDLPIENRSGNMRDMVINAKAHTLFKITSDVGDILLLAAFAKSRVKKNGTV